MVTNMNTISSVAQDPSKPTFVLIHGFLGGLAHWVPNWLPLIAVANVHAVDLPGFARSDRPQLHFKTAADVVEFFSERLDLWFDAMGLSKVPVILMGHSFGAYLSAHYTMRRQHLGRVQHLVLADPWGVAPMPADYEKKLSLHHKVALAYFYNATPLAFLRAAGPWGPKVLAKARPDFADRWARILDDPNLFYDYTYHCNVKYPTGEHAFQACCHGAAYAKQPLIHDLMPENLSPNISLTVLYGKDTWMDKGALKRLMGRFGDRANTTLYCIPDAGHQVNLDNARTFNRAVLRALGLKASIPQITTDLGSADYDPEPQSETVEVSRPSFDAGVHPLVQSVNAGSTTQHTTYVPMSFIGTEPSFQFQ